MNEIDRCLDELEQVGVESHQARAGHSFLRPIVFSLIQASYLRTRTLSEFAGEVVNIVGTAVSVPVAFAEGFLRSFLSIESVREDESGRVVIRPRAGANEVDLFREVNELAAEIDPTAIYNPVVRERLDMVAEATHIVMQQDLDALARLSAEELSAALEALEQPARAVRDIDEQKAEVRRKMEHIRRSLQEYQADVRRAEQITSASTEKKPAPGGEPEEGTAPA